MHMTFNKKKWLIHQLNRNVNVKGIFRFVYFAQSFESETKWAKNIKNTNKTATRKQNHKFQLKATEKAIFG